MTDTLPNSDFWQSLGQSIDATAYKPLRREPVEAARLESREGSYYVIKEPITKSYLRLSEADYALWWQMNGQKSIKDLLFYNLLRYRSLPIGHLTSLVNDLRHNHFLQDEPTDLYGQIEKQLAGREEASRGRRLINAFLQSEVAMTGLDDFFTPLYRQFRWLFAWYGQLVLLAVIVLGGVLFGRLFISGTFQLSANGGWSILSLILANTLVIFIHELGHGLATKRFGRELNRGGFLVYWGMPAFFVDTRDTWLLPAHQRIAVSWAGPHSGLVVGGVVGGVLTAVSLYYPHYLGTIWVNFLFQMGFVAYLSVFVNLNPLLELDGYFMLMDWLDMPGLRHRAFRFWREAVWQKWRDSRSPRELLNTLSRTERLFAFYGSLALVYSTYAILLALYFWQTRLLPFLEGLWGQGFWGQVAVLLITAVLIIPSLYYLLQYGWSRLQTGLEWLARRDLLARTDVLALLVGLPLLIGLPLLLFALTTLPRAEIWLNVTLWLLHLAVIATFVGVARQLPGSQFQWAMWVLTAVPVAITLAWVVDEPWWRETSLVVAGTAVFTCSVMTWYILWPKRLENSDKAGMAIFFVLGLLYGGLTIWLGNSHWLANAFLLFTIFTGLIFLTPLLLNFWASRFALPWLLIVLAVLTLPWLLHFPQLHIPVLALWLYAGLLYLLLGVLAEFQRLEGYGVEETAVFGERQRLINSFNHFMQAMFASYERVFGGRRLTMIQAQMLSLGVLDPDASILQIADQCRTALLLAVDRLDDLAGTPFTRKTGQAAYDSLPWLEAETLGRSVLADTEWGAGLAQGFIQARDKRTDLIRQADIFAGFDQAAVQQVADMVRTWEGRPGITIARYDQSATAFYLIESGEVGVYLNGSQQAVLTTGGYFGNFALLDSGDYLADYVALTAVKCLIIDRDRFDPLLRADTTLASQVSSGAENRSLLKKMPIFAGLSPQQLAAVDSRLQSRRVKAGDVLVRQGSARSHLFIVADGQLEVVLEQGGKEEVVGRLGPGEHFGEYALFADTPYPATCRAVVESRLLLLDETKFDQLVAECERMSHYVEQIGSGRLITTRRRMGLGAVLS